jgi:hypothetical protein
LPTVVLPLEAEELDPVEPESTLEIGDIPGLDDIDTSALELPDE